MRPFRLSTLLIGINAGLLLLAVSGVAIVAVGLLQQLADEQALARVTQAGASAQQAINRSGDDVQTTARLLAERPTLRRLLVAGDAASLQAFLEQFQQTSHLDGCAVLRNDQVVAQSDPPLPWAAIWPTLHGSEGRFLYRPADDGPLVLGAWAAIPSVPGGSVLTAHMLDEEFARQIGAQIELPVRILERPTALRSRQGQLAMLREQVLATGEPTAARLDSPATYIAVRPLRAPDGEVVGLIEVTLPTTAIAQSVRQLVQTLLLLALAVAALAAIISLLVSKRLSGPLRALTAAAARIGSGDLATPIPRAAGVEIGTLAATLEDMRQRLLRLTTDLRRQQAEAQAIVTGIVEGVFTVDRERRIRYLNPQAAALLGIAPEAAIGRFCGDVLNPQGPGGVRPCAEQCPIIHARFRGSARATEHLLLHDGTRRTVVITSSPTVEEQQVQVLRDETELEAVRRLRDAVLANISHEFRTPLSAQLASIELLLDQLPALEIDQIGQLVRSLQRGTIRLTQLIDNLLESVRIEAGQDSIRRQPVSIEDVIEEAIDLTRPLLDQRGQEVVLELPYPLPPIVGDAARLTQVFVNLLANANKFAPPGSTIRIGGAVTATSVAVWVEDQGPGLPPLAGPALFRRFVRAPAEEPEQSGMGLGLWIVKSIVERHGGHVDAQSTRNGTRMCVVLPQERGDENLSCG